MDDKSVDMILCDLPYGVTANKWDCVISLDKLWEHYSRIIKDKGVIVLTAIQPFTCVLVMSNLADFKYELVWKKHKGTDFFRVKQKPMRIHENILIFCKSQPTYNPQFSKGEPYKSIINARNSPNYSIKRLGKSESVDGRRYPTTVLEFRHDSYLKQLHPTQKPVALFEYLIKTYTNEGDLVLDNCIGSGTTAIACQNTKRNFIGFENNREYFDIACKRIKENQPPAFFSLN